MNLKNILAPLGDRIGELTKLVQSMVNNLDAQTELQQKIYQKLENMEKRNEENKGSVCKTSPGTD